MASQVALWEKGENHLLYTWVVCSVSLFFSSLDCLEGFASASITSSISASLGRLGREKDTSETARHQCCLSYSVQKVYVITEVTAVLFWDMGSNPTTATMLCVLSQTMPRHKRLSLSYWTFTIHLQVHMFQHTFTCSLSLLPAPLMSAPEICSITYLPSSKTGHHMTPFQTHVPQSTQLCGLCCLEKSPAT